MTHHLANTDTKKAAAALAEAEKAAAEAMAVYARRKARADAYTGPLNDKFLAERLASWRAATLALDRAASARRLARVDDYLARRRARVVKEQF